MSGFYWDSANPTPQIKMALSSGVLTVSCEGVCKVLFEKQGTPGDIIELDLSGRSWSISDDSGDDEIVGRMGTTASVAWGSAMPLFCYLVNKDNTAANVKLGLSRDPTKGVTPASEDNIGYTSNAAATSAQGNLFLANTAIAGYNSVPCQLVGSVTAVCDASVGGIWTFGTLTAGRDGIGNSSLTKTFATEWTFPLGQNGADAGTYLESAGTTPVFATNAYYYYLSGGGLCTVSYHMTGDGGTDGAGIGVLKISLPLRTVLPLHNHIIFPTTFLGATTINGGPTGTVEVSLGSAVCYYNISTTALGYVSEGMFSAGNRYIEGGGSYPAF